MNQNASFEKLIAAQNYTPTGLWRYSPVHVFKSDKGWQVRILWLRLLGALTVLTLTSWLMATGALFLFIKHYRGFSDVRYVDILFLPARWKDYQEARGEFLIRQAKEDLKAQRIMEAFRGLRQGLAKSPRNLEARLLLAEFFTQIRRYPMTKQLLLEGLAYHDEVAYLRPLFTFFLQQQEDQEVIRIAKDLLAQTQPTVEVKRLAALAAASACFFRGNYDQAEDFLAQFQLMESRDGKLLAIRIAWERGLRNEALDQLQALSTTYPQDEEVYVQTVAYLREANRQDEARRVSFVRAIGNPKDARARIDLLYALHKSGNLETMQADADEIFREFSNDSASLLALSDFAANTGNAALARRIYEHTKEKNMGWESTALMTVEAQVVSGDFQGAINTVREFLKANPDWGKRYYAIFNGLQAIAYFGLGDAEAAQVFLNNFLNQTTLRAENLVAVSQRLLTIGMRTPARQVLAQAVASDALNQPALTRLITLDLDLGNAENAATNIVQLLNMRKPPRDVVTSTLNRLAGDTFIFNPNRASLLTKLEDFLKNIK